MDVNKYRLLRLLNSDAKWLSKTMIVCAFRGTFFTKSLNFSGKYIKIRTLQKFARLLRRRFKYVPNRKEEKAGG